MARLRRRVEQAALLSLLGFAPGCPVDDRVLVESESPNTAQRGGSAGASGGASKGGSRPMGGAAFGPGGGGSTFDGEAGHAGDAPGMGGCPDLDDNTVADCEETLVQNADFKVGFSSWKPEPDISIHWVREDASDSRLPGALALISLRMLELESSTTSGASQCIPVRAGSAYVLAAHLFIAKGQGSGSAGLGGLFFDTDNCSGAALDATMTTLSSTVDTWVVTSGETTAPPGAQSLSIRLLTVKPFRQPSLEVLFDDVLLRPQ